MRHGVAVLPGARLDVSGRSESYLRLHFLLTSDELAEAVRRPAAAGDAYYPPEPALPPRRLYPSELGFVDRMAMCAR
jgi:hypothetical protein